MIRFGLTTDSHYADRDNASLRHYRDSIKKMQDFVIHSNREQLDFIIHLGDFKDEGLLQQEENTVKYLEKLEAIYNQFKGAKYHCVGNHDLDSITKQTFLSKITNTGISKNQSYYSFDLKNWHFIVLDSNYTPEGVDHFMKIDATFWERPNIPPIELDWLRNDLHNTKFPSIIFCHHPLFEVYHGKFTMFVRNYQEAQDLINKSGKVKACFHGHIHEEMHRLIDDVHYFCSFAMVDYAYPENAYSFVDVNDSEIRINGFGQAENHIFEL